jgi:hypothetical protein
MTYKFAYQVTKQHPYATDGDPEEQGFMALVREMASNPTKMYNLKDDECVYHTCPKTGNQFKITLQE